MSLFDSLRRLLPGKLSGAAQAAEQAAEKIYAVPVLGRKFTSTGAVPDETYLFYAYLYDQSPEAAVKRVRKEVRDEGFEFVEQAGQVLVTNLGDWDRFVETRFAWIKDDLPDHAALRDAARGLIHYSPKILRK